MRLTIGFVALAALSACQMAPGAGGAAVDGAPGAEMPAEGAAATAPAGPAQRVIERDVEAPDVFQQQEAGLWDGRPSLGGVWVAHPAATDPERVLIRNTRTGATVIGALFRRERDNPGPRFQVSSEAAGALGILAGAPTDIQVTALRLQRVEMEIAPAPAPATAATETLAVAPVVPQPAAGAAGATPAATAPAAAAPSAVAGAPQTQVAVSDVEPAPRRGLFDLFRRREPEPAAPAIAQSTLAPVAGLAAETATATAATTAATTASATQTMTELTSAEPPRERRRLRDLFRREEPDQPDTTLIPLPGAAPAAAAPAPATPVAAAPAAPAAPAQPASRIDRPFVQIGIFSVESNAENARAMMQRAGLSAEIRRGRAGENQFWRVVVGPAGSVQDRARILEQVRGLGFADAYAVTR